MKSSIIRKQFIDFFLEKDHKFIRSSSVVPVDDPTLLFTNAGMNQFKDIFLDIKKPEYKRAVNSQKCIRVSGKHNDLEEVGVDNFHHTFFEMLGNWSFGDYYKEESINWAWELLTKVWKIDKDRLWITIYKDDDEAYDCWSKVKDLDKDRILRFGNKDNFWEMGDTGPCGPCSEIHYYTGQDISKQDPLGVNALDEYRELWNLVFIQYNRESDGSLLNLPMKHVDTGLGLERIVSVLNSQDSHYDTDIFKNIINKIANISGKNKSFKKGVPHKVIADHLRMLSFSIADGAVPSNEGRGYVLRRVLRRAVRYGDLLGIKDPFLHLLVDELIATIGDSYPEISDKKQHILKTLNREEDSFRKTLDKGLIKFEEMFKSSAGSKVFSGENSFKLYDTYGFPVDLTRILCNEKNIKIDEAEFDSLMERQKDRARNSQKFDYNQNNIKWKVINDISSTDFLGYDKDIVETEISSYASVGEMLYIELKETPFYFESGGQIGDSGVIYNNKFSLSVIDVQKIENKICHICKLKEGRISDNTLKVFAEIDVVKRKRAMANHTATHLLHKALKNILGDHVQQAGSLVSDTKLRFDYTHNEKLSEEDIFSIEKEVESVIQKNIQLKKEEKSYDDAIKTGAQALFGEKYGESVRVVSIGKYSSELCGGTHVIQTGDIRAFKIVSESSLSSGVRRIEALTSDLCINYYNQNNDLLNSLLGLLGCNNDNLYTNVSDLITKNKMMNLKLKKIDLSNQGQMLEKILESSEEYGGVKVVSEVVKNDFDENVMSDDFRKKIKKSGVMVIGVIRNGKPFIACSITDDLTDKINANNLIKEAAKLIDGGGGGKKHFAKAGGKNKDKISDSIKFLKTKIVEALNV